MRTVVLAGACVLALAASSAKATIYNDNAGDTFFGGILDITSVEVTDDGTNINFKVNVAGDIIATDWGKYMVMMDTVAGGDNAGNGWSRPIGWGGPSGQGADYWLGTWVDGGNGGENRNWNGSSWDLQDASYNPPFNLITVTKTTNTASITVPMNRVGLGLGQTFCFDVFSSGGGGSDGAVDSLGNPAQQIANWGDASTAHPVCYTTTPEPGSLALLGVGALAFIRRKR